MHRHWKISRPLTAGLLLALLAVFADLNAEIRIETLNDTEFGFELDGSRIGIEIRDRVLREKRAMLLDWVRYSAQTVHRYYGRFPVEGVDIELQVTDGPRVRFGRAFGGTSPRMRIVVGEDVTPKTLAEDWIMVHEMVHLAMADVPPQHRWLLEGLATYVESIARAQSGYLDEDFIWRNFIERMPLGLPREGDRGLDHTPTWGRTYWGGALFCMLADIEIRRQTENERSLRDALRGVLAAGLSMHTRSTPMEIFGAGDRAAGVAVLVPLYQKMKADPYPVDLEALWRDLGLSVAGDGVDYDDEAPLAPVRRALLRAS